ncbi:MAG: dnaK [Actinomycetia bacterium]|nr:dnaK [Actinomycetes bacterium]
MSEQQGIYGIDLGTTYSVVAYIDETGRPAVVRNSDGEDTTPSVVYFENADNTVVGKTAKEAAGFRPDDVVSLIKREMGNKDYSRTFYGQDLSPSGISGIILAALAESAEEETHRPVNQVVITVPAYFGLLEKDATRKAGEIAGLEVIGIVPEPVAAALSYGVTGSAGGTTFLVYDLGGGTFDITLITMTDTSVEVLAVDGDHKLGGTDWDSRLFEYLKDQTIEQAGDDSIEYDEASLSELRRMAEDTKKALTRAESKKVNHRLAGGLATSIVVTRAQFEEMTSDLLEATITITDRMLANAEERFPGVRGQISDLLLVGGSSKMPAVAERLRKQYPWEPKMADPDLAVAKGAALYAAGQTVKLVEEEVGGGPDGARRAGTLPGAPASAAAIAAIAASTGLESEQVKKLAGKTIVNVLPKAVGIKLADDKPDWDSLSEDEKFYIEHLVHAQTQLPYKADVFTAGTMRANQETIEIEIWEQAGAVPDPALPANHRVDNAGLIEGLGSFRLPAGSPVEITFDVDGEGTVNLLAVEPTSGKQLKMSVKISIMSDEQVAQEKAIVSALRKGM